MAGDDQVKDDIVNFAALKLTNGMLASLEHKRLILESETHLFACLSFRLPLRLNADRYALSEEMHQVERHMRVCLRIDDNHRSITTIAPSEPILVEGACLVFQLCQISIPKALLRVLDTTTIVQSDRGELFAMAILLSARDKVCESPRKGETRPIPLLEFFKSLFVEAALTKILRSKPFCRHEDIEPKTFQDFFKDSFCHFTHFVRVEDSKVLTAEFVCSMMIRGAAILCKVGEAAIDIVFGACLNGEALTPDNMVMLAVQVKNDQSLSTPRQDFFSAMKPQCIDFSRANLGKRLPVIRMVFSLASNPEEVTVFKEHPSNVVTHSADTANLPEFMAYDIWVGGIGLFAPVTKNRLAREEWSDLLRRNLPQNTLYKNSDTEHLIRSMNPGTCEAGPHWARWVAGIPRK